MRNNRITRRSCLTAFALAGAAWPAWAQEPITTHARRGVMPIACRSVHLAPVVSEIDRTVITAVAADPRGDFVAVSGDDHAIRILDATSLRSVRTLQGHRDMIRSLAFDPRGSRLASAGNDGQLIIWDRDGDFAIQQRMRGTPALACITFSPDGDEMAAVGFDRRVYLIGRSPRTSPALKCDCNDLRTVAYRDDNKMLAVAGRSGDLHLFDPATGDLLGDHKIHAGRIHAVQFQKDSRVLVSVAEDGTMVVFDTQQGQLIEQIPVTSGKLFSIAVLDRRQVAVAGSDNVIRIIDLEAKATVRKLTGHRGSVATLACNGSVLYSGGFDATLRRWSLTDIQDSERIAESESAATDRQ